MKQGEKRKKTKEKKGKMPNGGVEKKGKKDQTGSRM